jgi:hypothetical protein
MRARHLLQRRAGSRGEIYLGDGSAGQSQKSILVGGYPDRLSGLDQFLATSGKDHRVDTVFVRLPRGSPGGIMRP